MERKRWLLLHWKLGTDVVSCFPILLKLLGYFKRPLRWINLTQEGKWLRCSGDHSGSAESLISRTWQWL